jgi:hypothetical protein
MAWTTLARLAKHGVAERVAHGVYRLRGAPVDEPPGLRAAWLQLAPDTMAWNRTPEQGVLCRWSAAAIYGLGYRSADIHQFSVPARRQTRRADVRLHRSILSDHDCARVGGLPATRPSRIAADLLEDGEAPEAVARVVAEALREAKDCEREVAGAIAPHAVRFGFAEHDGQSLLQWLLCLTQKPQRLHPFPDADGAPCETAPAAQFLLVRAIDIASDDTEGTTIRIATVMRQGLPGRRGRRRQFSGWS